MKSLKEKNEFKRIKKAEDLISKLEAIKTRLELSTKLGLDTTGDETLLKMYQHQLDELSEVNDKTESKSVLGNISNYGQEKVIDGVLIKTSKSAVDVGASAVEQSGEFIESLGVCVVDTSASIVKAGLKGIRGITSLTSSAVRASGNTIIDKGGDSLKGLCKLIGK